MTYYGFSGMAFTISPLNGKGDGQPDCKKKTGENNIGQPKEILTIFGMLQPVRHIMNFPEVVDKYHDEHSQRPEQIYADIPL
jgi:hypothetical protein